MAKPKKIKDGVRLSVVISKEHHEHVKKIAIRMSVKEGRLIGVSEAVRMALETVYPHVGSQMSLFNNLN